VRGGVATRNFFAGGGDRPGLWMEFGHRLPCASLIYEACGLPTGMRVSGWDFRVKIIYIL